MKKIFKSFNQFNESKRALAIDYNKKTFKLYYGEESPLSYDKKVSTKFIDEKVKELELIGFKQD